MANRTNFVKLTNLPPGFSNGREIFGLFGTCGVIQDMTAVDPTTVIVSYAMRSGAENAAFALNGCTLSGSIIGVALYFNQSDPQFFSNPVYQRLGQFIGQDHHVMDPSTFQPWGAATATPAPVLQPPTLTLPNYSFAPGFGNLFQQFIVGGAPSQPSVPVVPQPSSSSSAGAGQTGDLLSQHTRPWAGLASGGSSDQQTECTICLCDLADNSSYAQDSKYAPVLTLSSCSHSYHSACLTALIANSPSPFLQCPYCKKIYGTRTGNRPTTGTMRHRLTMNSVPGYPNCGTIEIHFHFVRGIQGPEHPNPGQPYNPHGFPRTAFLPDNQEGRKALHGLYLAWEQRLLFTVGRSITNGMDNCVTWNDIHLKTKVTGGEHSYPDPNHLSNLFEDLAGFGITEGEVSAHMARNPDLRDRGQL